MNGIQALAVTSPAFKHQGVIPSKYTCIDKSNISIPFAISNVPTAAKSLAWIFDDPDAPGGTWVHWVVFNVPVQNAMSENVSIADLGGVVGTNSWHKQSYGGPCPPSGTHRYYLKVYALDVAKLNLSSAATADDLQRAMKGHIIAQGQLMGICSKN